MRCIPTSYFQVMGFLWKMCRDASHMRLLCYHPYYSCLCSLWPYHNCAQTRFELLFFFCLHSIRITPTNVALPLPWKTISFYIYATCVEPLVAHITWDHESVILVGHPTTAVHIQFVVHWWRVRQELTACHFWWGCNCSISEASCYFWQRRQGCRHGYRQFIRHWQFTRRQQFINSN